MGASADGVGMVLIHGGGSSARFWDRVVPLLDGVGTVLAVDLPGRAGKAGDVATLTVDDEVASVVADVLAADLPDRLVLVAHSSGGLVVPGVVAALRGAGRAVAHIVLNAALVPAEGERGLDCMKPHHREGLVWAIEEVERTGGPPVTMPGAPDDPEPLRGAYGGDPLSDDDLAFVADPARTVPDGVNHYFQSVRWSQAAGVPVTYVLNERDRPVAPANQELMAARIPDLVEVVRLDDGHIPAVTDPEALASIVRPILAGVGSVT